ncbi:MAG: CcmD family protein [Candidatus Methanoperedens sp.]|jgi:CcmD family protein|nr:CcmD family protein [Candidatus Methanoperedens sp.]
MNYLYAAFIIVWVVIIAYILNLMRLHNALSNEIKALKDQK